MSEDLIKVRDSLQAALGDKPGSANVGAVSIMAADLYGAVDALTEAASENERMRKERDEARGWVRWLVRQAADGQLSLKERVSIVAHFPADTYPPHPWLAEITTLQGRLDLAVGALEELKVWIDGLPPDTAGGVVALTATNLALSTIKEGTNP